MRVGCLSAVLLLLLSCSSDRQSAGGEGEPCLPDGTCDPGLVCLAGICVQNPDSGWLDLPLPWPDGPTTTPDLPQKPDSAKIPDGPPPPPPDLGPPSDLPPPPDKGAPASCGQWSAWSCLAAPQPKVLCWATCAGAKGAIWCDGGGNCYCSGQAGNCATGVVFDLSKPCGACQTALEQHGCCQ